MKRRHAQRIRFAVLSAREEYEPRRLTRWQETFLWSFGEPKSWLLDGRLENAAYDGEARKAFLRIIEREATA